MSNLEDEVNSYILKYYERHEIPKELLLDKGLNESIISNILNTKALIPIKGKKKNLIEMAHVNATISLEQEITIIKNDERRSVLANDELRKLLNLKVLDRIESFDNSNLFGSYAVSGMVVFKNGKPAKNEYRKYKVSVDKNDDYNTMREVIYRRYYRCLVDNLEMPDLILVDGGVSQINACKSILDELHLNIKVCGLRKDDHHRTNELVDGDTLEVIEIPRMSDVFHYLTRIQDEVHRYTITYHKTLRDKGSIGSILDNINGIGNIRKKELIKNINDRINTYIKQGYKSIAIIGKDMSECENLEKKLRTIRKDIKLIRGKDSEYNSGISIVPSYLAKGLEFDCVLLSDVSKEKYGNNSLDIKLLYVSITRAMSKFDLFYERECSIETLRLYAKGINI